MKWIFFIICYSSMVFPFFNHDRAVIAVQKGDFKKAESLLTKEVINSPHNATVLYDAGVVAYKLNNFAQAQAYFSESAQAAQDMNERERALFNLGNTYVQEKKLKEAIDSYEKALELNPEDERARHNLEVVKKMLENEQKQQKQDQNKQNKERKEKEEKQQQNQNEQKKNDEGAESNESQKSEEEKKKSEQESSEKNEQRQQEQKQDKESDQDKNSAMNEGGQEKQKKEGQEQKENGIEENKRSESESEQGQESEYQKQMAEDLSKKMDAQLAQLLDKREQRDGELNKQLIKGQVNKQLAGYHGQNCW